MSAAPRKFTSRFRSNRKGPRGARERVRDWRTMTRKSLLALPRILLTAIGCVLALGAVSTAQAAAWQTGEVVAVRNHEQLTTRATPAGQPEQAAGDVQLLY